MLANCKTDYVKKVKIIVYFKRQNKLLHAVQDSGHMIT